MVDTIKFSEMMSGGDLSTDDKTPGLRGGVNVLFNNPAPNLAPGTTAERPAPAPEMYFRLRFNTTLERYEYYSPLYGWVQLESSADIANLIARLAAHTAGDGASMIGLEDQGTVSNKTVQDLAEMSFVTVNDDTGTLLNSQQLSALALLLTGGTMTGNIDMNNNNINNLPIPTSSAQAATKGYVDGIAFNTHPACNFGTTANLAGYTYDNGASGVGATLTAGSNGAFSTDGQSPALNDRILVLNQTNQAENGIYVLTQVGDGSNPAILTRATDYDEPDDMQAGDEVAVVGGDTLAGSKWMMTQTTTPIVIGTTAITWINIAIPTDVMTLSGAQTATGAKTFNDLILGGDANADSNKIINLLDPTNAQDAATKAYVDALASKVVQYVVATSAVDDTSTSQTLANSSLTANITPTSASNRIVVICYAPASFTTASNATNYAVRFDIRRTTGSASTLSGTPSGALAGHFFNNARANDTSQNMITIVGTEIAPSTSMQTYVLRFARVASSGTATILGASNGPAFMLILELKV